MNILKKITNSPLGVIALCAFIITIPFYTVSIGQVNAARDGCERLNVAREVEYNYFKGDRDARQASVKEDKQSLDILNSPHPIHSIKEAYGIKLSPEILQISIAQAQARLQLNTEIINLDTEAISHLKQSALEFKGLDNPVLVDCSQAYPQPFPVDLLGV